MSPIAGDPDQGLQAGRRCRRGATAMEYLVCASFILVVLIAGVQHLASVTQSLFQKDANATNVLSGSTGR
jgi:Flp pilus assembly pilin Flp